MIENITNWIKEYAKINKRDSLIVGISGGIDSSVVSTLCAKTNFPVHVASMPIKQLPVQHDLSLAHGNWLISKFPNVAHKTIDLSGLYEKFNNSWRLTLLTLSGVAFAASLIWILIARDLKINNSEASEKKDLLSSMKTFPDLVRIREVRLILIIVLGMFLFNHATNNWLPEILIEKK